MTLLKIPVYQLPLFTGFHEGLFEFKDDSIYEDKTLVNLDGTPATKPDGELIGDGFYINPVEGYEKEVAEAFASVLSKYFTSETNRDGRKLLGVEGVFNFTDVHAGSYRIQAILNIEASGLQFLLDIATSGATYNFEGSTKTVKTAFIDYVNSNYSSRSGFTSYISNDALEHVAFLEAYLKDPTNYDFDSNANKNILTGASHVENAIVVLLEFLAECYLDTLYRLDYGDDLLLAFYYAISPYEIAQTNYTIEVVGVENADSLYYLAEEAV